MEKDTTWMAIDRQQIAKIIKKKNKINKCIKSSATCIQLNACGTMADTYFKRHKDLIGYHELLDKIEAQRVGIRVREQEQPTFFLTMLEEYTHNYNYKEVALKYNLKGSETKRRIKTFIKYLGDKYNMPSTEYTDLMWKPKENKRELQALINTYKSEYGF